MVLLVGGLTLGGIPAIISICFTGLNPFQILLVHIFPSKCSLDTICLHIISTALLLVDAVISVRYITLLTFFMVLLIDTYAKYWKGLQCRHDQLNSLLLFNNNMVSSKYIYMTYQKLFCLYVVIRDFLLLYSVQAIFGSQIFITIALWVSVTGLGRLSPMLVLMFGTGGMFLFVAVVASLHFIVQFSVTSNRIINDMKCSATRKSYKYSKWRAVRPLNIECGNQFHITQHCIAKYCEVLNANLTNAIFLLPR